MTRYVEDIIAKKRISRKIPKLEYWANKYALKYWGRKIEHPILWNKRMNSYWGKVVYKPHGMQVIKIEISPKTIDAPDMNDRFHKTLKHELCHYFLILNGIEHKEFDEVFLNELRRTGASMPVKVKNKTWSCYHCQQIGFSGKRFNKKAFFDNLTCDCPRGYWYTNYEYAPID